MVVGHQVRPFLAPDAVGKAVGIEGGHRDHAQHLARPAVHDDDGGGFIADAARGIGLEVAIDGEADGVALLVGDGVELAQDAAAGVDLDAARARLAAQPRVERLLHAVLAEPEAGKDVERVLRFLELLARRRADIAEQMPDRRPVGIEARKAAHRLHARKLGQADVDRGEALPVELVGDLDGDVARVGGDVVLDAGDGRGVERNDPRDLGERRVDILDLLGDQLQPVVGAVERDRPALAVDDPAAPRRDQAHGNPIVLGEKLVLLLLEHREPGHAPGEHEAEAAHPGAEQDGPAREQMLAIGLGADDHGAVSRIWRRASTSTTAG